MDDGLPTTNVASSSSQSQDTGYPDELKESIHAWLYVETFKSVIPSDQYMDRVQILRYTAESRSVQEITTVLPHIAPSFVYRTRRDYTLKNEDCLIYHARKRKGPLIAVPQHAIFETIEREHNAIHHQGTNKTWYEISTRYHGIPKRAVDYVVRRCEICHSQERGPRPAPIQAIVSHGPMERVQMDLIDMRQEPDGDYHWILHIKDHYSRFCMLYPLRQADQEEVVTCVMAWIAMLGPPTILQTDNGAEFVNEAISRVAEEHHICIRRSAPRHPRSQGLVERANGHVRRLIAKWCRRFHQAHWARSLPSIAMACNMSVHATVGRSPYEVVFSRRPKVHRVTESGTVEDVAESEPVDLPKSETDPDIERHIAHEQDRMIVAWKKRHEYKSYKKGAHVSVSVHRMDRMPLDDYRLPGIVVAHKRNSGYRICTEYGVLKRRIHPRCLVPLPDGSAAPAAAQEHAALWHTAPRISLAACARQRRACRNSS